MLRDDVLVTMIRPITDDYADQLLRACRTAIGDELRSLTHFTPDDYTHIYLRSDPERGKDPISFVETERLGFTSQQTYEWSELGDYEYTIRVFENGYIVRVIEGDHGAYATTDPLTMDRFDEVAEAIHSILADMA